MDTDRELGTILFTDIVGSTEEELGRFEDARGNYELFLEAWRDADPERHGWVENARQAAIRLSGLGRG